MKQDGTYQLLEAQDYIEFIKVDKPEIDIQGVELVYTYYDNFDNLQQGRHWLDGDVFIMNESGNTISSYQYKVKKEKNLDVYVGDRSEDELNFYSEYAKDKRPKGKD
jgi:hypothetical protein